MEPQKIKRKIREGVVVSDKMNKTIIVAEKKLLKHSLYNKNVKRTKKYVVHDEMEQCNIGDKVKIVESKPLSKTKRWMLLSILTKKEQM